MNAPGMRPPRWVGSAMPPAPLRGPVPLGDRVSRTLIAALVALALLVAGLWWWLAYREPSSLADAVLVGARGPACLRLVVAQDVSGSMSAYAAPRSHALEQLVAWAPANLRDDDELVVLDFAATAGAVRGPAVVGVGLPAAPGDAVAGGDTLLVPVIDAVAALPATGCDTLLVLLSDALVSDLPASADAGLDVLVGAGVHDVALLVPSGGIDVPAQWAQVFPTAPPVVFDGDDAGTTGLALARTIADVTGQQVTHR